MKQQQQTNKQINKLKEKEKDKKKKNLSVGLIMKKLRKGSLQVLFLGAL